jgi:predicted transcriptional regulator
MKSIFQSVTIDIKDLIEQVNISRETAQECISKLNEMKLIVKIPSSNYYRKNPGFNKWLKAKIIPHEMADRGASYGEVHDK